jgi:hypothetical protein
MSPSNLFLEHSTKAVRNYHEVLKSPQHLKAVEIIENFQFKHMSATASHRTETTTLDVDSAMEYLDIRSVPPCQATII